MSYKKIYIAGIRGIPAAHGGFESFAEEFALYLKENGWDVNVYCQLEGEGEVYEDEWRGVRRINIPVRGDGASSSVVFDWKTTLNLLKRREKVPVLTLGYNTAVFSALLRVAGIPNVMNMDGIEWARAKWSLSAKVWFWGNEKIGSYFSNHLIADHPEIKKHLMRNVREDKITMIPYGAPRLEDSDESILSSYGLRSYDYALVIARPEPENSILEIVKAFSSKPRSKKLVVLGRYSSSNSYQGLVLSAARDNVKFLGAIYDKRIVNALREYALLYVHGHRVGGTNPSLVEALGAGCPVLAHDNRFNRWVAGEGGRFFSNVEECSSLFDEMLDEEFDFRSARALSYGRHEKDFTFDSVNSKYEKVISRFLVG